jgi:hypothetical protein
LKKANKSKHGGMVQKIFKWVACAKRLLMVEELLKAVIIQATDQTWPEKQDHF